MFPLDKRQSASRTGRHDIIGGWIFVTIWCGGTFPMFYLAAFKSFDAFGAVVTGVLALVGVSMLWVVIRMTLDFLKFGVVSFTPQRGPVRPGGQMAALVEFLDNPPPSSDIEAELRCCHVTWSRGMRGGTSMGEETAWSASRTFPLRKTGSGAIAAIMFDIPADARPTDLPGERPGESGWMRLKMEQGKPLHFHRWEVTVTAKVPGLDFERSFKAVVEPAIEGAATGKPIHSISGAAPLQRREWNLKWVGPALALALFAIPIVDFVSKTTTRDTAPSPVAQAPVAQPTQGPLPSTTPWTTATSTWAMPMPTFARHAGVAANGIRYTRTNDRMQFTFDEIVIEKNPAQTEIEYFELNFNVVFDEDSGRTRSRGGFSGQLENIRGKLTAGNPVLVLRDRSIVATTPQGNIENMRYRLSVNVVAPSRKYVREESIEITDR